VSSKSLLLVDVNESADAKSQKFEEIKEKQEILQKVFLPFLFYRTLDS